MFLNWPPLGEAQLWLEDSPLEESQAAGFGILFWNPVTVGPEADAASHSQCVHSVPSRLHGQNIPLLPRRRHAGLAHCQEAALISHTRHACWCPLLQQPCFPEVQLQRARIWGTEPKLVMARSVWVRWKGTAVADRRGSWSWQSPRRGCQFSI